MKTPMLFMLLLAAALMLPAMAQQVPGNNQTAATPSQGNSQSTSTQNVNSDQNLAAHQPLEIERQGFWARSIRWPARSMYSASSARFATA